MKKDKLMKILLPAVIVLVAVVLAVLLLGQERPDPAEKPVRTQPVRETAATVQTTAPADTTVPSQTVTEPVETQTEETREEPGQTEAPRTEPEEEPWEEPTEPETVPTHLEFPCQIPGTELVIGKVSAYDGLFLEDGQDIPVENVCAIVVTNISGRDLEYAEITLNRDGTVLEFRVSGLTAGSSAMVLEYGCAPYEEGTYLDCSGSAAMVDGFELSSGLVDVKENADGSLTVTNCGTAHIPCVRIFYKFYMNDVDVFVGGITYTAKLEDLDAGESMQIQPSHYLAGMSRIVMVKTYDTAQ